MGKIIDKIGNAAIKAKEGIKKNGPNIIKTAGLFTLSYFAGYGIGNFIADVSGAREQSYLDIYNCGQQVGWSNGYEDGMTASAVLRGIENGVVEPKYIGNQVG